MGAVLRAFEKGKKKKKEGSTDKKHTSPPLSDKPLSAAELRKILPGTAYLISNRVLRGEGGGDSSAGRVNSLALLYYRRVSPCANLRYPEIGRFNYRRPLRQ